MSTWCGSAPSHDQRIGLPRIGVEHAVAHETVADTDQHAHLVDRLGQLHDRRDGLLVGLRSADVLHQLHDVGRREEVGADHLLRPLGGGGDLVHIQRRGVARQDRALLADRVELAEDLLLDIHLLEHRFDHDVGLGKGTVVGDPVDQRHALIHLLLRDPPARDRARVVLADDPEPLVQGLGRAFENPYRDAGVGEVHGDAAAHGAAADDGGAADRQHRGVGRHVGHLGRLALGKEQVALAARLVRSQAFAEQRPLLSQALLERQGDRVLDALDAVARRDQAARAPGDRSPGLVEEVGGRASIFRSRVLRAPLPSATNASAKATAAETKSPSSTRSSSKPLSRALPGRHELTAQDRLERRLDADHPRQPLGAAGTRQQTELDLRQTEAGAAVADPVVAAERQFQAAAEGGAVDRRHHRLRAVLELGDHLAQVRVLRRLAELADIRAGAETAPLPGQHQRLDAVVARSLRDGLG